MNNQHSLRQINMLIKQTSQRIFIVGITGLAVYGMSGVVSANHSQSKFIRSGRREISDVSLNNNSILGNSGTISDNRPPSHLFSEMPDLHTLTKQDIVDKIKEIKEDHGAPKPVRPKPHQPPKIEIQLQRNFTKEKDTQIKPKDNKKSPS